MAAMSRSSALGLWSCLLGFVLSGCTSLDDYRADTTRPYVGTVLGQTDPSCDAGTGCSFLRRGFRPGTEIVMTFDPDQVDGTPGTLTTRLADGSAEPCAQTFDAEPLRAIAPLAHDALSQLSFPGEGRQKTYVFALSPTQGALYGRDAYAFVSLMRGGEIELRILSGSGEDDCAPTDCAAYVAGSCDFFGVFRLKRRDASP